MKPSDRIKQRQWDNLQRLRNEAVINLFKEEMNSDRVFGRWLLFAVCLFLFSVFLLIKGYV